MSLAELERAGTTHVAEAPILEMDNIDKEFVLGGAFLNQTFLRALSGVSLQLTRGRALALVGESGSGKSTCARMLAGAYQPTGGTIRYRGEDITTFRGSRMQQYRSQVQMVFQDPFGSLNPTQSIGYHLERPIRLHRPDLRGKAIEAEMLDLLERVGLRPAADYLKRRPHELSGGQRQRVAIARALSVQPDVLLADEPTSMLDVSVRLGILNLLEDLKRDRQLAALYITHDIATARYFAEETAVMYAGHLVEQGPSQEITDNPRHPYTQLLIESVPNPNRKIETGRARRAVDIPVWTRGKTGCPFVSRCPRATAICKDVMPGPTQLGMGHTVRCHNL
ncbi:oligopeptide/dipeptide ABC transporter, ATP-binding protein, C-terminal domain-containing protein [Devosia lucknowensis]|uniref:Oligopeptide/dipeptide ABC transporter, ATP-binding protein, C-terminal domain-containing protein n=1 Tax=Devosia lucknowensis TaxID=1096929 RepID=A0A1Y6ED85_9HYPH|nr:ABC transporter ATP-binding protein [Devosia lucknowensis]SMQ60436.1 oligopeptide/dipeptide ABC transporter, ATP-binding protein, C-terminal domain-containing protein [Devosia lucknowensis]